MGGEREGERAARTVRKFAVKNMRGVGGERDFELVFPAGSDKIVQSRARAKRH